MIRVIEGLNPVNLTDNYDVVLVGTNIYGRLSNGWQLDMKVKYPEIHKANLNTKYADKEKIGKYISVTSDGSPTVCLLYITNSKVFRPDINTSYLDYDALESCLHRINIEFKGKKIICPILGSSKFDGNGDKEKIIEIFKKTCDAVDVTLYDYEQISRKDKTLSAIKEIMKAKKDKDKTKYYALIAEKKAYEEKLREIHGIN